MIYVILCAIIAGLLFACHRYSQLMRVDQQTIKELNGQLKWARNDRDAMFAEYNDLKARIVDKATPKVVNQIPKRYTGAQIRIMNDRMNAKMMDELQERPNSEILKEQANG